MTMTIYEKFAAMEITEPMIEEAAQLFSNNYGIWGKKAAGSMGSFAKKGTRVKMSPERLRLQYLPKNAESSYVRVTIDGELAGNVFACRWNYKGQFVCWVTQLVVHYKFRERGLATGLLNELKQDDDDIYGLASSHAAACLAAAKVFRSNINSINLDFTRRHAASIMKESPVDYLKSAKPCGSLFSSKENFGMISSVNTNFFVDHEEPLKALTRVRDNVEWPLGELIDGHEFLLVVESRRTV